MWTRKQKDQSSRAGQEDFTFLGEGIKFKGVASFVGTVRIDGRINGEIHTDGRVEVGPHAVIEGTITACELISNGRINGSIIAAHQVRLLRSSILIGEVHTPVFSVEEGAHFEGLCSMWGSGQEERERSRLPEETRPVQPGKFVSHVSRHLNEVRS